MAPPDFRKFGPELNYVKEYFPDLARRIQTIGARLKIMEARLKIEGPPEGSPIRDFPELYELLWRMLEQQRIMQTKTAALQTGAPSFVREIPGGAIDGVNKSFTISSTPQENSLFFLTYNGVVQEQGADRDFTVSGTAVGMTVAPRTGGRLMAWYIKL